MFLLDFWWFWSLTVPWLLNRIGIPLTEWRFSQPHYGEGIWFMLHNCSTVLEYQQICSSASYWTSICAQKAWVHSFTKNERIILWHFHAQSNSRSSRAFTSDIDFSEEIDHFQIPFLGSVSMLDFDFAELVWLSPSYWPGVLFGFASIIL